MGVLRRSLEFLIRPSSRIQGSAARARAELQAAVLLLLTLGFAIVDVTHSITDPHYVVPYYGYGVLLLAYSLSRSSLHRYGGIMAVAMFPAVGISHVVMGGSSDPTSTLNYMVIGPFVAGAFLGWRGAAVLGAVDFAAILMLPFVTEGRIEASELAGVVSSNLLAGAVAVLYSLHRDYLDQRGRSEVRTREVQLRQAQKMEALGRLAGGIAHDFNNLLTVISGGVELLKRSSNRRELDMIHSATGSAIALTEQLLLFSRQGVVDGEPSNPTAALKTCGRMISRIIGEHVEVVVEPNSDLWSVPIDESQIHQVILNLATNARDAMPNGGVLRVAAENVHLRSGELQDIPSGDYVVIAVSDSGVGMDEVTRERIFEPFFTTKEVGKGTGLGLSMVFGIVKQGGGHVRVETRPGRGTSVRLYLPRCAEVESKKSSSGAFSTTRSKATSSILLVEDDAAVRELCASILTDAGYRVTEAPSASSALSRTDLPKTIDLVLTDVVMPGLSGPEMVARLRDQYPDLSVLYMSGYAPEMSEVGAIAGSDLLRKPFGPDALLGRVRQKIEERRSRAPAA